MEGIVARGLEHLIAIVKSNHTSIHRHLARERPSCASDTWHRGKARDVAWLVMRCIDRGNAISKVVRWLGKGIAISKVVRWLGRANSLALALWIRRSLLKDGAVVVWLCGAIFKHHRPRLTSQPCFLVLVLIVTGSGATLRAVLACHLVLNGLGIVTAIMVVRIILVGGTSANRLEMGKHIMGLRYAGSPTRGLRVL